MTYSQVFKSHYSRVVRERVLKAAIFSIIIGLGVAAVIAFVTIFTEFNGLWTAIGAGLGVAAILTPILYFALFRPSQKSVAESLDRLGFDERIITMLELEDDCSIIAELQRNDAVSTVTAAAENNGGKIPVKRSSIAEKLSKLGLNRTVLIIAGVVLVVAIVSLVLTSLPTKKVKEIFVGANTYTVTYNSGDRGYISTESDGYAYNADIARAGKFSLQIEEGKSGERIVVTAYDKPDDSYMFVGWSDDYYDPLNPASRCDDKVLFGFAVSAQYIRLDSAVDDPADDINSNSGENPGMSNNNAPPSDDADGNGKSHGEPDEIGPPSNGASASDSVMHSEIIDGQTDYQENFQEYYDEAMRRLSEGKDIPESLRKLIAAYFEALK